MPDTHAPPQLEPWQWSEEHWRKLVKQVRAGQRYRPASWPDGARCAVALSASIPTMRPTSCATAASRSAGCAGASTAAGWACRASAPCSTATA